MMMKGLWETAEDALGWLLFVPWAFCSVQNRVFRILPLCHDPPRRRTRARTHTQMHGHKQARWQSGLGNSLRTPRQPDTLPNTTLAHTHVHKHTQNSPFVGGGPSRTGTREGRKVFCQASLLSSQKRHTNTSRRVAAKRHGTLRQWLSVSCGTHRRDTQHPNHPPQLCPALCLC